MADTGNAGRSEGWRFWAFTLFMLALMVLFVALGLWQVLRLDEKERLIAAVAARFEQPPIELPPVAEWAATDSEQYDFRPVTVTGTYLPEATVLVFTSLGEARGTHSGPGYWVMTPLRLATGGTIFVNRGFVPQSARESFAGGGAPEAGMVSLSGVARLGETVGGFTPAPELGKRIDWVRNPARLATLAGRLEPPIAPLYIDLPAGPPGTLPQGGETVMSFPNNHLGYVITWFGFAALVPPLLWFWIRRQRQVPLVAAGRSR
jgi:surfeit locus 1 family protein